MVEPEPAPPKRGPGRPRKVEEPLPPKPPPRRTQSQEPQPVYEEDSMAALARLLAKHKGQQLIARKEQLRNLLRL